MGALRDLRQLLRIRDFRRLFTVRMVSQAGDGMFQIGLATLFFFSPESQGTAASIAVAFAILLAPFTLVGPWAGVLLDRWRRRQVLVVANATRVVITVVIAVVILVWGVVPVVYALALLNLSLNRFLLAALSASLPRVVDGPLLLTANALVPTLGAGAAGAGALVGLGIGLAVSDGTLHDALSLGTAAILFAAASALALVFSRDRLGPERLADAQQTRHELARLGNGLVEGARLLVARRTPAQALVMMATHRFLYGLAFVASILLSRNSLGGDDAASSGSGMGTFTLVLAATSVGFALAVVLTPTVARHTGPQVWIVVCLVLAAVSQAVLALDVTLTTLLVCAVPLGLAAQGAKIAVDTIVQRDTPDEYRGRAFALYDVLYNTGFIGASALAAVTLPDSGYSPGLFAGIAVAYAAAALVFGCWGARTPN
ncbi:MFS transporter [Sanguibacter antarcticus]|uniref:MFS transporter n=1 Tax=Sanguibacter antarcticus TaxID=372484 RepID=UPI000BF3AF0D|nr:MFS transporter [Sanguibacter antarcticus]